jgi:hypothetical protein
MQERHIVLSAGSVHVSVVSPASFVHMDSATVDALELVKPARPVQQRAKQATLLGLMNHTKTACGAKLLRVRAPCPTPGVHKNCCGYVTNCLAEKRTMAQGRK